MIAKKGLLRNMWERLRAPRSASCFKNSEFLIVAYGESKF